MWKVARHPLSRHVVACDDYSFQNTIVSFTMKGTNYNEIEIKTVLKGILKRVPLCKNRGKANQNVFMFVLRFHKVRGDLKDRQNGFHE